MNHHLTKTEAEAIDIVAVLHGQALKITANLVYFI